jgi:ATP-dependent RNA helicase DDX47/RRP3
MIFSCLKTVVVFRHPPPTMNSAKRIKVAQGAHQKRKKPVVEEKPARPDPEPSSEEESEEESATLEEPSAEETAVDAPKKTFKDLVWLVRS